MCDIKIKPSEEQLRVINSLKFHNVIVNSVAGSGKTTTNIFIAKKYNNSKILLLTYNKKLREDTLTKIKKYDIKNLDTYTYHSFCVRYYKKTCYRDSAINSLLMENLPPHQQFNYDIIIIDEAQDMTPLYYKLFCKLYYDNKNKSPKICILGDIHQNIYCYNRANAKFIEIADKLFNFNEFEWKIIKLSQSFRVTNQIATFVNKCLLGYDRIMADKDGDSVDYIVCNTFGDTPFNTIMKYINEYDYKYDDFFILAPSLKSEAKTPIAFLQQKLTENDIPIFIPADDNTDITCADKLLLNKIVFSTFHQVKGLERKVVMIFNFDNSYFKFYDKTHDPKKCPNTIYVACTRSLEKLLVLQHKGNTPFEFINTEKLKKYAKIKGKLNSHLGKIEPESDESSDSEVEDSIDENKKISVTKLISHLPFDIIDKTKKYIDVEICSKVGKKLKIANISEQKFKGDNLQLYESVADINGIAIPAYYEYLKTGKITICPNVIKDELTINDVLEMTTVYSSIKNNFTHKLAQIKNYDWVLDKIINRCMKRMENLDISEYAEFEKHISFYHNGLQINGSIDCYSEDEIFEFKCVSELEHIHILQLAVYMYLVYANDISKGKNSELHSEIIKISEKITKNKNNNEELVLLRDKYSSLLKKYEKCKKTLKITNEDLTKEKHFYLYNILDNNLIYIKSDIARLKKLMDLLVNHKISKKIDEKSEKSFLENMLDIKSRYKKQINSNKIMILDIETSYEGDIVQMAWFICDENYNILSKHNYYNKVGNDYYGKIDKKTQELYGIDIKDMLSIFVDSIKDIKYIIGHNVINFDMQKISNHLNKHDIDYIFPTIRDTMAHTKNYCNLQDKLFNVKNPKLDELYFFLYGENMDEKSHLADYDILITLECVKKLKKLDYDVIENYREYDYKVIKKPVTVLDKLIFCIKDFKTDKNDYKLVYDSKNKKYISLRRYLINTYGKISAKSIENFFENNDMDINGLKKFCNKHNITLNGSDIEKNIIHEFIPDGKSKYKIMKYIYHLGKIYPVNNNYFGCN